MAPGERRHHHLDGDQTRLKPYIWPRSVTLIANETMFDRVWSTKIYRMDRAEET